MGKVFLCEVQGRSLVLVVLLRNHVRPAVVLAGDGQDLAGQQQSSGVANSLAGE